MHFMLVFPISLNTKRGPFRTHASQMHTKQRSRKNMEWFGLWNQEEQLKSSKIGVMHIQMQKKVKSPKKKYCFTFINKRIIEIPL